MSDTRETVWIKIKDYAKTRHISESTVRRLIKAGRLKVDIVSPRCVRIRLTRIVTGSQEPSLPPRP